MHEMSEELRHEIPAQVKIVQHANILYARRHCEKNRTQAHIKTAKASRPVIEKGWPRLRPPPMS